MPPEKRINELLNMFYLLERPQNISYGCVNPSKIAASVINSCTDQSILSKSIAGFPGLLEELRALCNKNRSGYDPSAILLADQGRAQGPSIRTQPMRGDVSTDRSGKPPKHRAHYLRAYDWRTCSCILPQMESGMFRQALRVLLDSKQQIKVTTEQSVNPGEWVYAYGSSGPMRALANMGQKRPTELIMYYLFSSPHESKSNTLPAANTVRKTPFLPVLSKVSIEQSLPHAQQAQNQVRDSISLYYEYNILLNSMLNTYVVGTFLAQPLQGNLGIKSENQLQKQQDSSKSTTMQSLDDSQEQDGDDMFEGANAIDNRLYTDQANTHRPSFQDMQQFDSSMDYLSMCEVHGLHSSLSLGGLDRDRYPLSQAARNIRTLYSETADGIQLLGEYFKNERVWRRQTASILAQQAIAELESRARKRFSNNLIAKPEAAVIEHFWATIDAALDGKAEEDTDQEEVLLTANTASTPQRVKSCDELTRATDKKTDRCIMEVSDTGFFVEPHSPVHPFELSELSRPRNIDKDSLYYSDDEMSQRKDEVDHTLTPPTQLQQQNSPDLVHDQQHHLIYQALRQTVKVLTAEITISLTLLQLLFCNLILDILSTEQLMDVSTASSWIFTVGITITTGKISAVSLRPQRGSSFLFRSSTNASKTVKNSTISLHTHYKYLLSDISLLSVSHYLNKQPKTPKENFLARLEITRAAFSRLLHLNPSTQYSAETHAITQLLALSDYISSQGLQLENRFFAVHSLSLRSRETVQTLTEIDMLVKCLKDHQASAPLVLFESFVADVLDSGFHRNTSRHHIHAHNSGRGTSSRGHVSTKRPTSRGSRSSNLEPHKPNEALKLYEQLRVIYKDIWQRVFISSEGSNNEVIDAISVAPHSQYVPNTRYLLPYQAHMLLSISASYATGNKSLILRAPRKTGTLKFIVSTFLSQLSALQHIRSVSFGECADAKTHPLGTLGPMGHISTISPLPTALRKENDTSAMDPVVKREQVHLVLCEEDKVEGFLTMYIRFLFGMRVYNTIYHEIFGGKTDKYLEQLKSKKLSQNQARTEESVSMTHESTAKNTTFYPSVVTPITFTDLLSQKMLLDDLTYSLTFSVFSRTPMKNSVAVAEITRSTEFGPVRPQKNQCNIGKCIDLNLADNTGKSAAHSANKDSCVRTVAIDAKKRVSIALPVKKPGLDNSIQCVTYVIGPEMENQRTISVPSRLLFNLFDQTSGRRQQSKQTDLPVSIKLCVVTYDALHYNYAYTNKQILSLIKDAGRLDTLITHRIKDHAPHLPLHLYKTDFFLTVESTFMLNKGEDLRQEAEVRKKLTQLQNAASTVPGASQQSQRMTQYDGRLESAAVHLGLPSYERPSRLMHATDQTTQSEQNDLSMMALDKQQSEHSSVLVEVASLKSSTISRVPEENPVHFLFCDLVALNCEGFTPLLTNIYTMNVMRNILANPVVALHYFDAFKKSSYSTYLQDIHSYCSRGAHYYPHFYVLPPIMPQDAVSPFPPEFDSFFPTHNTIASIYPDFIELPVRQQAQLSSRNRAYSVSSISSSLKNAMSQMSHRGHFLSHEEIKLIEQFASFDAYINALNIAYNSLLIQYPHTRNGVGDIKHVHSNDFWVYIGLYMPSPVSTTTMHTSSLDSIASVFSRSYDASFGRAVCTTWLRGADSDASAYLSDYSITQSHNWWTTLKARLAAATNDHTGTTTQSTGSAAIMADVRRSLSEAYLNSMQANLERIRRQWVATDGRLLLMNPDRVRKRQASSHPSAHPWMLAYNMSLSSYVYDRLFNNMLDANDTLPSTGANMGPPKDNRCLYFTDAPGTSMHNVSRSVAYQTRAVPLFIVIKLLDILKQAFHKLQPCAGQGTHYSDAYEQRGAEKPSFSQLARKGVVSVPLPKAINDHLDAELVRTVSISRTITSPLQHQCCWRVHPSLHSIQQPNLIVFSTKYCTTCSLCVDHMPLITGFSLLSMSQLAMVLPSRRCPSDNTQYPSESIQLHTSDTKSPLEDALAQIKNRLNYSVKLRNNAVYVFKVPFKTHVQQKHLGILGHRPLLRHLYRVDQQKMVTANEDFINRVQFSALCVRLQDNNASFSRYVVSIAKYCSLLLAQRDNTHPSSSAEDAVTVSFSFEFSFFSYALLQLFNPILDNELFSACRCLLPLNYIRSEAANTLTHFNTREAMLASYFLISTAAPKNSDFLSFFAEHLSVTRMPSKMRAKQGANVQASLISAFISNITSGNDGVSNEHLLSLLQRYTRVCCSTYCLSPVVYKILTNCTQLMMTSIASVFSLSQRHSFTLNSMYNNTPVLVTVCFAIRRIFIESNLCGKHYKPVTDIIKQSTIRYSFKQNTAAAAKDQAILCPLSLEMLNISTARPKADCRVNSSPPPSYEENSCDSTRFSVRYTHGSNQSSDAGGDRANANSNKTDRSERTRRNNKGADGAISEYALSSVLYESSIFKDREPTEKARTSDMIGTHILYVSTPLEPPRKHCPKTLSKADEIGRHPVSMHSEISAVDAAERVNEPSEQSGNLSDTAYIEHSRQPTEYAGTRLYTRDLRSSSQRAAGTFTTASISGDMHKDSKIHKPYTLTHENSDDNEHDTDDRLKGDGFNFVLILASNMETLQILASILHFALSDCKPNVLIAKPNEVFAYITTSSSTTVTTVSRRGGGVSEVSESIQATMSRRSNGERTCNAPPSKGSDPLIRNLASEGENCIVLQLMTDFLTGIELYEDARRIHLFIMPCVPNILIMDAINRASLNTTIMCWSNQSIRGIMDNILQKEAANAILMEKLVATESESNDLLATLPTDLQYIVVSQADNKPLQQLLLSIIGLLNESGHTISLFSLLDDEIGEFSLPKMDSYTEQESLSTESYVEAGKRPLSETQVQTQPDMEALECGSNVSAYCLSKADASTEPFILDHRTTGVNRNLRLWKRCIRHSIYERLKHDLSTGVNGGYLNMNSSCDSMLVPRLGFEMAQTADQTEHRLGPKQAVTALESDQLQEVLSIVAAFRRSYAQMMAPLHDSLNSLNLALCPLEIVKFLSHTVFLAIYSSRTHLDAFVVSPQMAKLVGFNGCTQSRLQLADLMSAVSVKEIMALTTVDSSLTVHSPVINLLTADNFMPSRSYHCLRPPITVASVPHQDGHDYVVLHSNASGTDAATHSLMPAQQTPGHTRPSSWYLSPESDAALYHYDGYNKGMAVIGSSSANDIYHSEVRAYKRVNLLAQLSDEIRKLFVAKLTSQSDLCFQAEFLTSQPLHISVAPIMETPVYRRKLLSFCERQLPYEDIHPSEYIPVKQQGAGAGADRNTLQLNSFLWNRQLLSNLLSLYLPYETLVRMTQSRIKYDEYTAFNQNTAHGQTPPTQLERSAITSINYSLHDSFTYRKLLTIGLCENLTSRYNELNRILRIKQSSGYSSEIIVMMINIYQANTQTLYQQISSTITKPLSVHDKKVITYILRTTESKLQELNEWKLNAKLLDQFVPKLGHGLDTRDGAIRYILTQSWCNTGFNPMVDNLKARLIEHIDSCKANKRDTDSAEKSLMLLLLYDLDCTRIVTSTGETIRNNSTFVQHCESAANLVISNSGCHSYKKQPNHVLAKESLIGFSANICVTKQDMLAGESSDEQTSAPSNISYCHRENLGLDAANCYSDEIYGVPESYAQKWKPLW